MSSKDFWTLGLIFGAIYLGVFLVIGVPISDFTRDRPGGIDDFGRGARDQSHESRVCFWDRSRRIRSDRIFSADFFTQSLSARSFTRSIIWRVLIDALFG